MRIIRQNCFLSPALTAIISPCVSGVWTPQRMRAIISSVCVRPPQLSGRKSVRQSRRPALFFLGLLRLLSFPSLFSLWLILPSQMLSETSLSKAMHTIRPWKEFPNLTSETLLVEQHLSSGCCYCLFLFQGLARLTRQRPAAVSVEVAGVVVVGASRCSLSSRRQERGLRASL